MIGPNLITSLGNSFEKGESINMNLPLGSQLVIDQKLPFICVYRFTDQPELYLSSLIKTQSAYLIVNAELDAGPILNKLIDLAIQDFTSFLILEFWNNDQFTDQKNIELWYPEKKTSPTVEALLKGFSEFRQQLPALQIIPKKSNKRYPDHLGPLIPMDVLKKTGTLLLGIAFPTLFKDPVNRLEYPIFYRKMSRKFAGVIKIAAYEFVRVQSDNKFEHYLSLGKTRIEDQVLSADKKISKISEKLDFLLMVSPVNSTEEWEKFKANRFSRPPRFRYRLIYLDPEIEKRKLFNIKLENVDHPTLGFLLRDKRLELEKQLIMLEERGTKRFFHLSRNIYGEITDSLKEYATSILNSKVDNHEKEHNTVNAVDFARHAEAELDKYRPHFPGLDLQVNIKDNVNGLIVSGAELSIGKNLLISPSRLNALIQHEVGTHMLTYCNGHAQPLGLMYSGFAGYEQTQEGIAVFLEYLVGGLDISRLRILAARVMAVDALIAGADFIETFNLLWKDYGFESETAFNISMRVHRGGGFTKDAIYLNGLIEILKFIKEGGDISQLFGGKFALEHLPFIEELTYLRILKKPMLPEFLHAPSTKKKLSEIKTGNLFKNLANLN